MGLQHRQERRRRRRGIFARGSGSARPISTVGTVDLGVAENVRGDRLSPRFPQVGLHARILARDSRLSPDARPASGCRCHTFATASVRGCTSQSGCGSLRWRSMIQSVPPMPKRRSDNRFREAHRESARGSCLSANYIDEFVWAAQPCIFRCLENSAPRPVKPAFVQIGPSRAPALFRALPRPRRNRQERSPCSIDCSVYRFARMRFHRQPPADRLHRTVTRDHVQELPGE